MQFYGDFPQRTAVTILLPIFSGVFNFFVCYVIVRKTPKTMVEYKKYLRDSVIGCQFFITTIFFTGIPYVVLMIPYGDDLEVTSVSIIDLFDFGAPLWVQLIIAAQGLVVSFHVNIRCCYYRMFVLQPKSTQRHLEMIYIVYMPISIVFLELFFVLLAFVLTSPTKNVLRMRTTFLWFDFSHDIILYRMDFSKIWTTIPSFLILCIDCVLTIAVMYYTWYCLYSERSSLTERVRKIHKMLFWALVAQFATVLLTAMGPILVSACVVYGKMNSLVTVFNFVFYFQFGSYGFTLGTTILITNLPYRKYLIDKFGELLFWRKKAVQISIPASAVIISRSISVVRTPVFPVQ